MSRPTRSLAELAKLAKKTLGNSQSNSNDNDTYNHGSYFGINSNQSEHRSGNGSKNRIGSDDDDTSVYRRDISFSNPSDNESIDSYTREYDHYDEIEAKEVSDEDDDILGEESERDIPLTALDNHSLKIRALSRSSKESKKKKKTKEKRKSVYESDPLDSSSNIHDFFGMDSNPYNNRRSTPHSGNKRKIDDMTGDQNEQGNSRGRQPSQKQPKPTEVMSWDYVPLSEMLKNEQDALLYATSCDELDDDGDSSSSSSSSSGDDDGDNSSSNSDSDSSSESGNTSSGSIISGSSSSSYSSSSSQSSSSSESGEEDGKKIKPKKYKKLNKERDKLYEKILHNEIPVSSNVKSIEYASQKSKLQKKEKTTKKNKIYSSTFDKRACFGCMWGNPKDSDVDVSNVNRCIRLLEQNYGRMNNSELARMVHTFFKHKIYLPMRAENKKIPMWRSSSIKIHIEEHMLEPRIFIGESIKGLTYLLKKLQNKFFKRQILYDGTVKEVFDPNTSRFMIALHKQIIQHYKLNPKQMNFFNETSAIDLQKAGLAINPSKNWEYKR